MAKQPATTKTNAKAAEVMAAPATDSQAAIVAPEAATPATDSQAAIVAPEAATPATDSQAAKAAEVMAAPATDTAQAVAAPTIDAAALAQVMAQQAQMLAQMQALQAELTASKQAESLAMQLLQQQQTMAQHSTPAQTGLAGGPQFTSARKKAAPLMGLQGVPAIPGLAPKVRNSDVVRAWILQAMQQNSPSVDWIVEKAVKELGMSAALAKRYISENWPKVYAQFSAQGGKIGDAAQQAAPTDGADSVE